MARIFLNLVAKHLPKENNLQIFFNKNTLNVSYGYSQNIEKSLTVTTEKLNTQTKKKTDHKTVRTRTAATWMVSAIKETQCKNVLLQYQQKPIKVT